MSVRSESAWLELVAASLVSGEGEAVFRSLEPPWKLVVPYGWWEEMGKPRRVSVGVSVTVEAKEGG